MKFEFSPELEFVTELLVSPPIAETTMLGEITDSLDDELVVGGGENQTDPDPESDDGSVGSLAGAAGWDGSLCCGLVAFEEPKFRLPPVELEEFCPAVEVPVPDVELEFVWVLPVVAVLLE